MKSLIKKITPPLIIQWYHWTLSYLGILLCGFPSEKLIIIGVTGTNGKSTVVNLVGNILKATGQKVAWLSTANFHLAGKEWLNDQKMTMLGRFKTQKFLKDSVKAGCRYVVVETSSEGIKQYRHLGINYDVVVFTNLTPEHIESHGSFEKYKQAKGKLFQHLTKKPRKKFKGRTIDKVSVVNTDDQHADYFLNFPADKKITYSISRPSDFQATDIELNPGKSGFKIISQSYQTNLLGKVNVYNCLAAISVAKALGISDEIIAKSLAQFPGIPGRFEFINKGLASLPLRRSGQDFKMMVDYAPEPESLRALYETLQLFRFNRIIHVLGSTGGGRDKARRPILGRLAAENADTVIITNEDPYDENPQTIIDQVAQGAEEKGKVLNQNLFKILDRKEAIQKALSLAQKDNLVLITGKGCEQFICVANGNKIPWDDRKVIRELLNKI
ncbi:MAG: hypothetical protein COT24_03080 [Candidatus Kerfeldbacteria bacterium CG08_land_8_20_14_0_20_40_16]|uniref:UDP-N-acetylmuramoyl-L-alanyl-D-glutamate--2, 6-diaminopimelate ligase n=1 Tax=Candidatus Kerfeldbacteria bacterium CG08_land_8_20_14_0_20_40_16 TaxID=2014244 RepID=A0A2H0YVR9_9BACT|nr:MAG: hypothetical protein COT24_03080 [Candidatus Kerfeldbacteria bacterium CG08_land_8_20_14_0_20_40_16]